VHDISFLGDFSVGPDLDKEFKLRDKLGECRRRSLWMSADVGLPTDTVGA
jgi:hypothetical protein